jgi:2-polyprenyl-6-hydroxyphenyl methylase/3-demethylubiquinone-9 3-methyltransferase
MQQYRYNDGQPTHANYYLWPALKSVVDGRLWQARRAFDLGCGNGSICSSLASLGFECTGVDMSESGIALAQANGVDAHIGSAYDDLASQYGTFPLVVSLEVIEHCMDPRAFIRTFLSLIAPGGVGFLSTPYHGYLKNIALAVSGKMDAHYTALWDGGHIKFFSVRTLRTLLKEAGATDVRILRIGRVPALAKSMAAVVYRPPPSDRWL